ncbi:aldehyde dehydrogenase family protein [Mesorhizobium sp. VNQ89]|uniref:aldehyde dehydrogenase family protein n=1 Tax=Mesorhizobium quangtriensis TaxID=3157709 RepID=UPI0032B8000B
MTVHTDASKYLDPKVSAFVSGKHEMLIGGKWRPSVSGKTLDVLDPANGKVIAAVPAGEAADVDLAVKAAREAFNGPWSRLVPAARAKLIWKLADLIDQHGLMLAQINSYECGKPIGDSRNGEVPFTAETFRYYAGWATKLNGEAMTINAPGDWHAYTRREPVGVAGQIIPWNFPLAMLAWKVAPALATGCTIVLKPAEQTPLGALYFGRLVEEAGFPEGVVNIVTGFGEAAGAAMSAHPDIDKIAFTGSTEVGKMIARAATGNLKKVSLELGGKAPTIVLGDADIEMAVAGASSAAFFNAGQSCGAGTRFFVHRKIYDKVMSGVAERAEKLRLGAGLDPASELGPVVSQQQMERITRLISEGRGSGAEIVTGGERAGDVGYFVKPTIISSTTPEMAVMREEIFGPVVCAMPFDDEDLETLAQDANDTEYGLAASIWTNNLGAAHKLAAKIKSGTVWINCHNFNDVTMPFGGFKQSGWGRELGAQALDLYTQTKTVAIRLP